LNMLNCFCGAGDEGGFRALIPAHSGGSRRAC
jgi:hypothetical protein